MSIIGVDPGLDGAITFLDLQTAAILQIIDMPTLKPRKRRIIDEIELARQLAVEDISHAFVELVSVRPGEGAVGAFSFGLGYGVLRGILRANFIPITYVTPQVWKRAMGIPPGAEKDASIALAKEIFQHDAGLFTLKKHHGRAESALIALWGREVTTPMRKTASPRLHSRKR